MIDPEDDVLLIKTFKYDLEEIATSRMLDSLQLRAIPNQELKAVVFEMTRRLATWRARETLVVEWPANWWQHFKQRWFPRWALQRWPVLMHTETHRAIAFLPNIPVRRPEDLETAFFGWKEEEA